VGAGISGIAAAVKLREAGLHDFKIIERASRVGGTWRENTYPGCGCDVPSSLYSYSFFLSSKWSRLFAKQPEILSYLEEVSDALQITPLIDFNTSLESATWDESRHVWVLVTNQGEFLAVPWCLPQAPLQSRKHPRCRD